MSIICTIKKNIQGISSLDRYYDSLLDAISTNGHIIKNDLLTNPIFRWMYLGIADKILSFKNEMDALNNCLGEEQFNTFITTSVLDLRNQKTANAIHNRMLDMRAEILGMLHYFDDGHSITLVPRDPNQRRHDFNAIKMNDQIAVEAKFIRYPDKLGQYLMRWWQAKAEITGARPLGRIPYIKFRWNELDRNDLNSVELTEINHFFGEVFTNPGTEARLESDRLCISYSPKNGLMPAIAPLAPPTSDPKHPFNKLMSKFNTTILGAIEQLEYARQMGSFPACFMLSNISEVINFHWKNEYEIRKSNLIQSYSSKVKVFISEVGYL